MNCDLFNGKTDNCSKKGIDLNGAKTVEEVKNAVVTRKPANLAKMLEPFDLFIPLLAGDKNAIERVAYELCEDAANSGVVYFEARYSPHLLCNTVKNTAANSPFGIYVENGRVRQTISDPNTSSAIKKSEHRP
ncbi:unnamed protein product [Gongylonema pulchrum]|uniref:adenosine deaminase n=1 Tax=Gongylonema pulchrum TaxID=637853 RepID=A0A183D4Z9_9BILA|nr:unnamed protein product [Gongylonema pulchrum]